MANKPTDEQTAILDAVTGSSSNLILNALAGTGKTSTLRMIERATKTKPVLYLVFNKANARESEYDAKAKNPEGRMQSTTTVRTLNSLGHRIWAQSTGKNLRLPAPKKRENKCADILRDMIKAAPQAHRGAMWDSYWPVLDGVAMAKAMGYKPNGYYNNVEGLCDDETLYAALDERPDDLVAGLIDAVLAKSIAQAYDGYIDYNDQVYMPAVFGGIFPQFPLVMVDEYQDLNNCNHKMVERLCRGKTRLIGVGDPAQSIYAFRGACTNGMQEAQAKFSMQPLSLSVSFRCPQAIVEAARWRVPHFKWSKAGGHVEGLSELPAKDIPDSATFLCRNNAPLFRLAMQLLSAGRSVSVAGSDIGPKLIAIMRKLGSDDYPRKRVLEAIAEWEADKVAKESKTAADLAGCMRVFAEHGNNLSQAVAYAEHLFKQDGSIRLSTGHKAKGLEWNSVFLLDPWLCREDEQDLNLRYVMQTRSADSLFEVDTTSILWK